MCSNLNRSPRLLGLIVGFGLLAGCQTPVSRQPVPDYPTFPPLRHAIKAVFGPNGNDCGGDLQGKGEQLVQGFHDLRIDLTRIEFKWAVVEAKRGTYDWSELDRLIGFLHDRGIEPMLMLYCAPAWAMRGTPADEQLFIERGEQNLHSVVWPRREFLPDFERFCETAARRYRGRAKLFEFWNEPDGMAGPTVYHDRSGKAVDVRYGGDAKEYTLWLKHMYAAVKRGNPDAVVAAGSLCVHDTRFIEAMYASGCRDCCDAISLHPYAGDGINVDWVKQCRQVMNMHGDWGKPVWLSEFGWNLGGDYDDERRRWPSSAVRQAQIITATAPVVHSLPYITHAFWFTLNDWNTSQTGIDPVGTHRFGVMDLDGRRRPGFEALRAAVHRSPRVDHLAEMPLPQAMPPANPSDAGQTGHVNLALSCWFPDACSRSGLGGDWVFSLDVAHNAPVSLTAEETGEFVSCRMDLAVGKTAGKDAPPNTYEAVASVGYGIETRFPVTLAALARHVDLPPKIDGALAEWPANWSIHDGQMKAEFSWTKTHLFFACVVQDTQHQQPHRGRDIWKGDCVQIAFDPRRDAVRGSQYDINDSEYAVALTADGPQIWRYICPPDSYVGIVAGARVAVRQTGDETTYEVALPWSELGVSDPGAGRLIGTAMAVCDWTGGERKVHRFGDGIIGKKEPYRFASIRLAASGGE